MLTTTYGNRHTHTHNVHRDPNTNDLSHYPYFVRFITGCLLVSCTCALNHRFEYALCISARTDLKSTYKESQFPKCIRNYWLCPTVASNTVALATAATLIIKVAIQIVFVISGCWPLPSRSSPQCGSRHFGRRAQRSDERKSGFRWPHSARYRPACKRVMDRHRKRTCYGPSR